MQFGTRYSRRAWHVIPAQEVKCALRKIFRQTIIQLHPNLFQNANFARNTVRFYLLASFLNMSKQRTGWWTIVSFYSNEPSKSGPRETFRQRRFVTQRLGVTRVSLRIDYRPLTASSFVRRCEISDFDTSCVYPGRNRARNIWINLVVRSTCEMLTFIHSTYYLARTFRVQSLNFEISNSTEFYNWRSLVLNFKNLQSTVTRWKISRKNDRPSCQHDFTSVKLTDRLLSDARWIPVVN